MQLSPIATGLSLTFVSLAAVTSAQDWVDAPRVVMPDDDARIRKVGDLDGDGDADLLAVEEDSYSRVSALRPFFQGPGGFQEGPTTTLLDEDAHTGQGFAELGDLTGDGLSDLVMDVDGVNGHPSGVRVFVNNGDGFDAPVFVDTESFVWGGALEDADANGTLELALLLRLQPSQINAVGWWRWNGTTLAPRPHTAVTEYASDLVAADFTGDGRSEILVGLDGPDYALYSTLPGGQPAYVQTYHFSEGEDGRCVRSGDLDGDGDVDLLVSWRHSLANGDDLKLIVVENEGGVLTVGPTQSLHVDDYWISGRDGHLADWDLDGDLDFLTQHGGLVVVENQDGVFAIADSLRTVRQDPFAAADNYPGAGVGDLNGDGLPDFAAGSYVYAGDGALGDAGSLPGHSSYIGPQDFDADGDLDVVSPFFFGLPATLLENDGRGRFVTRGLPLPAAPAGHFFAQDAPPVDLDGDGFGDLLRVLHRTEYPENPVVETRFFQGSAFGTYTDARAASAPGVAVRPAVYTNLAADLDDDGDPDVLAGGGYWENDGTGFFPSFHPSWNSDPVRTLDVDGDGDLDVLARTYPGVLSLARNQGGVFTSQTIASGTTVEPALGDLDGDGDLDLGVDTDVGGPAVLLFENAAGSFVAPLRLDLTEVTSWRVAFEDFDDDGRIDVLAIPMYVVALEWHLWRQSAGWEFAPPVTYLAEDVELCGDFDGDGDLDFFGPRLVRSRRFEGPADGAVRQHGAGWAAAEPAAPLLGVRGPLRPGSDAVLRVARARGGAVGQLLLSNRAFLDGPAGKARLHGLPYPNALAFALDGTPGASGEGSFELSLGPATLALQGQTVWMQAVIHAPGSPRRFDTTTNALELTFGQ
jgi:VCBS repeat protein